MPALFALFTDDKPLNIKILPPGSGPKSRLHMVAIWPQCPSVQ